MALTREFFLLEEIITSDRERAILTSKKILNILARSSKEKPFFFYRAQLDNLLGRLVQKTGFTRYFTCRWFGCLVFFFWYLGHCRFQVHFLGFRLPFMTRMNSCLCRVGVSFKQITPKCLLH
jgi:hypothetical protein